MRRAIARALLCAIFLEALSFIVLMLGRWEFMGEVDALGKVGVLLHYPGFRFARAANMTGNISWAAVLGVPCVLWFGAFLIVFGIAAKIRRKSTRRDA